MSHHPRLLQISKNLYIQPKLVSAVRWIDDDSCNVFIVGASVVDGGLLVHRNCEEVVDDIDAALDRSNRWDYSARPDSDEDR